MKELMILLPDNLATQDYAKLEELVTAVSALHHIKTTDAIKVLTRSMADLRVATDGCVAYLNNFARELEDTPIVADKKKSWQAFQNRWGN